jgi:hypothetical protein
MTQSPLAVWPVRPWYQHKKNVTFEDILRTARRALGGSDILAMLGLDPSVGENQGHLPTPRRSAA